MKKWTQIFAGIIACMVFSSRNHAQFVESLVNSGHGPMNNLWQDIALDGGGTRFVCGEFEGNNNDYGTGAVLATNFNSAGLFDGIIGAYAPNDQLLWAVTIAGSDQDDAIGICVAPDVNNALGVYVTGFFTGTNVAINLTNTLGTSNIGTLNAASGNVTDQNYFVMKLTEQGGFVWAYTSNGIAATEREAGFDISAIRIGNNVRVNVCGRYSNQANFDDVSTTTAFVTPTNGTNGDFDGFVLSYQDNGGNATLLWGNTIRASAGANNNHRPDAAFGITCDEKGGAIVTGQITPGAQLSSGATLNALALAVNGSDEIFASRYNELGTLVWGMRMGGAGNVGAFGSVFTNSLDVGTKVTIDRNGAIYVTGCYAEETNPATTATFGALALQGYNTGIAMNTVAYCDIFMVRLNDGSATLTTPPVVTWIQRIGSTTRDFSTNICVDNCGVRLYMSGSFEGPTLNFNPAAFNFGLLGTAGDGFFAEFDAATGITTSSTQAGGGQWEITRSIAVNSVGDVSVCGDFNNMNINVGGVVLANTNSGWHDAYIARWDNITYPIQTSSTMTHGGIAVNRCESYTSGSLQGSATVNGIPITSTGGSSDVYLMSKDLYGNNGTVFTRLTNDAINTTVMDEDIEPVLGNLVICGFSNAGIGTTFVGSPVNSTVATRVGFVCETNTAGAVQWVAFAQSTGPAPGPANIWAVTTNYNGDVFVCGNFTGTLQFRTPGAIPGSVITVATGLNSMGAEDYFIAKFDYQGHLVWATSGGGTGNDNAVDLKIYGGELYVTGLFQNTATFSGSLGSSGTLGPASSADGFVLYFIDVPGTTPPVLMSRASFSAGVGGDVGSGIDASTPNNVIVACNYNSNTGIVRSFDMTTVPIGSSTWTQTIAGTSFLNGVTIADERIFVCPFFTGPFTMHTYAMNGTPLCDITLPGYVADMALMQGNTRGDDGENIFLAGNTIPLLGSTSFVSRVSAHNCGSATRLFNPAQEEENTITAIMLYPNPTSGSFTLEKRENDEIMDIEIFDFTGRSVFSQKNLAGEKFTFDLGDQPNGVYLVRVISGTEVKTIQLIKD